MAEVATTAAFRGTKLIVGGLALTALGGTGTAVGFVLEPTATWFGYLTALAFAVSIALGALVLLMTTYVVGAKWNVVLRRLNEGIISVFPLLFLLSVPLAFGLSDLYLWAQPWDHLSEHERHLLEHKSAYLNQGFFLVRSALYFAIWTLAAWLLSRWSAKRDDRSNATNDGSRETRLSAALLPAVALALTFASFDWLMSLQPLWFSTLFGVYYFAGGFVASCGLLATTAYFQRRSSADSPITSSHFHALGRLMFAFSIFWAYCAFFQALLIKSADKPEEVQFYIARLDGGWSIVAAALLCSRFVIPFFVLLPRAIKLRGGAMAAMGLWLVMGQYLDVYWLVLPVLDSHGALFSWWDLSTLCAVGGCCVAFAGWRLSGKPIIPVHDPRLAESIAYRSPL